MGLFGLFQLSPVQVSSRNDAPLSPSVQQVFETALCCRKSVSPPFPVCPLDSLLFFFFFSDLGFFNSFFYFLPPVLIIIGPVSDPWRSHESSYAYRIAPPPPTRFNRDKNRQPPGAVYMGSGCKLVGLEVVFPVLEHSPLSGFSPTAVSSRRIGVPVSTTLMFLEVLIYFALHLFRPCLPWVLFSGMTKAPSLVSIPLAVPFCIHLGHRVPGFSQPLA